jgi:hypothetical protein
MSEAMTETEWQNCTDLFAMYAIVRQRLSARKLRLFGVAFCRFLRNTPNFRNAVIFEPWAEQVADGLMSLDAARAAIKSEWGEDHFFRGLLEVDTAIDRGVARILALNGLPKAHEEAERLLHCIAGNPFRPINLDTTWLTPAVKVLAQSIYDDRTFERLPDLADELEKSGCDNQEVLGHCRGPGPHVRGCWLVDLVLGKE